MVDDAMWMTARKSCKDGRYESFQHLLFLYGRYESFKHLLFLSVHCCASPAQDPEDLPFQKGDVLELISKDEDEWWTARDSRGRVGQIPVKYTTRMQESHGATNNPAMVSVQFKCVHRHMCVSLCMSLCVGVCGRFHGIQRWR